MLLLLTAAMPTLGFVGLVGFFNSLYQISEMLCI